MVMPYYFDPAIGALRSIPPKEDPFDMDSAKHGSSETSSMDDQLGKINSETSGTGSRSYDCSFCKRGFTNAQALGGHMNIHRKDKAKMKPKAKRHVADPSPVLTNKISTNIEECVACVYFAPNSSQQVQYCAALGAQMNYQMRFRASNPSFPHAYHTAHLTADSKEYTGADLSLQIGEEVMKEDRERNRNGNGNGNEIDLELRLGHNP